MNNTNGKDKKQPMSDEELSKISGGIDRISIIGEKECPYCGHSYNPSNMFDFDHPEKCSANPKNR